MKRIVLAKRSQRFLAALVDLLIILVTTAVLFLFVVYPITFNFSSYHEQNKKLLNAYEQSELFIVDQEEGKFCAISEFAEQYVTLDNLYNIELTYEGHTYVVNTMERLYLYYTERIETFFATSNYDLNRFKTEVLLIGTEDAVIASFNPDTYQISATTDETKALKFIIDQCEVAATTFTESKYVKQIDNAKRKAISMEMLYLIPTLTVVSFIFFYIIPLCSKTNKTIGKHIFHLIVLDSDGYKLKKKKLLIRWLTYLIAEVGFGIVTMGSGLLISYTMFLFKKKRRCLHDVTAKSVVAEEMSTIYFDSKEEEEFYKEQQRLKNLLCIDSH